jgi:Putative zinc-finger
MNTSNSQSAEHRDIWELLPWLVNERLSEADCRRVEAHLRMCGACRDECAAQRQIYQAIAVNTAIEQMPTSGLNRLRQRIERTESSAATESARAAEPSASAGSPLDRVRPAAGRRPRAAAIAACVVAVAAAVGISPAIHWQSPRHGGSSPFYTVTTGESPQPGAVIRAVFAPTVTLSELQGLLDDAHLRIVAGPTEAGVYSLAMIGPQSIDWSLHRLRGQDMVRFAESIRPAPVPAPP